MKILRRFSVILLVISTVAFTAFQVYIYRQQDQVAPEILFGEEVLTHSCQVTEEELLSDVTAVDDRSGDVTSSVVVEQLSDFLSEGERIITYAAIDEAGNVSRRQRSLQYTDYEAPSFSIEQSFRFPQGRSVQVLKGVHADSPLDGDLSDMIKYSLTRTIDISTPGFYPVQFRVIDSAGKTTYLDTEIEIYDSSKERLTVELTDYLIYIKKGSTFDPMRYVIKEAAGEEETISLPTVESDVNTAVPGIYTVDYTLTVGEQYGKSRLLVIVTE